MSELSALPDAGSLTGLELVPALQGADARKLSTGQIRAFIAPVGLRAAPRIAYLGDSILAHGQSIATNILQNNNIPFWTHFLGGQRYDGLWFDIGTPARLEAARSAVAECP